MDFTANDTLTKHEHILRHIESLKTGSKISVRKIAKEMDVSEGTAYKAIKEAENKGLVSTRERIGTVRIEKKRDQIEHLTFGELVSIVDGVVLGGENGLHKTLSKFVIGAMQLEDMMKYIEAGSLLIVGNRNQAHRRAVENGAAVLITGGFDTAKEVKNLADQYALPIISSDYDTYTVASIINRAIYDRLIKRKIFLVEDILSSSEEIVAMKSSHTVQDWEKLYKKTGLIRYPVIDEWHRVIGMISLKDLDEANTEQTIDKYMTRNPLTVDLKTSIASAAHLMDWEGIKSLPVVDSNRKILGVVTRKEVMRAMQYTQGQPQIGETFEDLIWSGFEEERDEQEKLFFKGFATPQMTNRFGSVSEGVLTTIMTQAAFRALREYKKNDLVLENMSTYFLRPVQFDSEIKVYPRIIELSRKFSKIDVEVYHLDMIVSKAMLTAQLMDQD